MWVVGNHFGQAKIQRRPGGLSSADTAAEGNRVFGIEASSDVLGNQLGPKFVIVAFAVNLIDEPLVNPFAGEYAPDWLEEKYLEPAKTLRVFIAHGTKDQAAKYELGVKSNEILTSYGYDVTFHSFDGGHTIDPKSLKRVLEWLNIK